MVHSVQAVTEAALQLSLDERRTLVEQLLDSLDAPAGLHPAWHEEVARRLAAHRAGSTTDWPAEEALAMLAEHIHSRRPAA